MSSEFMVLFDGLFIKLFNLLSLNLGDQEIKYGKSRLIVRNGVTLEFVYLYLQNEMLLLLLFMQEEKRNTQTSCTNPDSEKNRNVFLLKKITEGANPTGIYADFTPYSKSVDIGQKLIPSTYMSVPVFNRDGRHYTPSFILSQDISKFDQNEEICLTNHIRKVQEMEQEKEEMFLPKPSKGNSFCQICREPFDQYLTHINRPSHVQKMRSSQFYKDILNICEKMNPQLKVVKQKKIKKQRKKKEKVMPVLNKKNSVGKLIEPISTGLQTLHQCQM